MIHKFSTVAAWASLALIVYATLSPAHLRPELTATEPNIIVLIERVGAFAVLGLLFSISYPRHNGFVSVVVLGGAVVLELLQTIVPDRDARVVDAIQKMAGGGAGILAAQFFMSLLRTRAPMPHKLREE
jgi:VanZ family protein